VLHANHYTTKTTYPVGTVGPFPGGKASLGRDADHSPHLVPRSGMSRSYTFYPPYRLYGDGLTALWPVRFYRIPSMLAAIQCRIFDPRSHVYYLMIKNNWPLFCMDVQLKFLIVTEKTQNVSV
jgi:hypothetical protein